MSRGKRRCKALGLAPWCFAFFAWSSSAFAFDDKDCARIDTVSKTSSLDLKSTDSVEAARSRITAEIVKQSLAQVVGYDVHSDRSERTQITNQTAEEKYQDADQAVLDGRVRVKITDEKRAALATGQTLTMTAEVQVCVPKPDAVRKAERQREAQLQHPPKPADPSTAVWFNPATGEPQLWYVKHDDGSYLFFDNAGFDPQTGDTLRSVTSKVLKDWRLSIVRREREVQAAAMAAKQAAEAKLLENERQKIAEAKQADLITHARDNCDKLASNPNDPMKPSSLKGATFDELRLASSDAVAACEAAVKIEPADKRLRYQLARAYSADDPKRAVPMFRQLCSERYPAAFDNYGWTFLDRRVGGSNLGAAIAFFRKGAQLGDSDAMVSLAGLIQRNKVPGSASNEALLLYQRASSMGNEDASRALEPLIAAQQQAEQQRQQDLKNAQAIMGLMGGFMGGMRR